MIKTILASVLLLAMGSGLYAQQNQPNPDAPNEQGPIKVLSEKPTKENTPPPSGLDKLRLGGSFGLSLGTITNIDVSPMIGLQLNERLTSGIGVTYQIVRSRLFGYNSSTYGARGFAFYHLFQGINLNGEVESISREYFNYNSKDTNRTWLSSVMVGGSYSQPMGGRFTRAVNFTLLYNLSYNNLVNPTNPLENIYPTASPLIIRVTFF